MPLTTLKQMLRHQLGVAYDAEQQMLQVLDRLETETASTPLRDRVRLHRDETRRHASTLERCLELMGMDAPRVQSDGVRGLREERRAFYGEQPTPRLAERYELEMATRLLSYQCALYDGVARLAAAADEGDVLRLVKRNLSEDAATLRWLEEAGESLSFEEPASVAAGQAPPAVAG